jgi:hypothetical protein
VQCQNNLKQMGLALHSYHDVNLKLPPAVDSTTRERPPNGYYAYWSWMARIMPFYEQDNLYKQADAWARSGTVAETLVALGRLLEHARRAAQPSLRHPGEDLAMSRRLAFHPRRPHGLRRASCARSPSQPTSASPASAPAMAWACSAPNRTTRLTDIADGTSNTLMVGERPPSRDLWYGWWFAGGWL